MKIVSYFLLTCMIGIACSRKMSGETAATANDNSVVVVSSGHNKKALIPPCIQKRIDSLKQQPVWNPPAEIHEYEYNGKRVFVTSSRCCDSFAEAFDESCNYICAPSGGFTGKGDGKCSDFDEKAKYIALIWKDERVRK